jgi:hypothetical protein
MELSSDGGGSVTRNPRCLFTLSDGAEIEAFDEDIGILEHIGTDEGLVSVETDGWKDFTHRMKESRDQSSSKVFWRTPISTPLLTVTVSTHLERCTSQQEPVLCLILLELLNELAVLVLETMGLVDDHEAELGVLEELDVVHRRLIRREDDGQVLCLDVACTTLPFGGDT